MDEELEQADTTDHSRNIGRRLFLSIIGLAGVGVAFGTQLQNVESWVLAWISKRAGTGVTSVVPGASEFRLYSVTESFPYIPDHRYRLTIDGLVAKPRTFTLTDLQALPSTSMTKDFQCVTGWRVKSVHWRGVLLRDLLNMVEPSSKAGGLQFTSYDGVYTESLTMAEARRSDVIVAYEMLGAPITSDHGGPVRMYIAPMYGYKSTKWLKSISLVEMPLPGFWELNGYDIEGWIGRSNGRTDAPIDGSAS